MAFNLENVAWEEDIKDLFAKPYWIEGDDDAKVAVGKFWRNKMGESPDKDKSYNFGIFLDQYESVKQWSRQIYLQVRAGNMPMTTDPTKLFPQEAQNLLYHWIIQGCREKRSDPKVVTEFDIVNVDRPPLRVRKDISTLTSNELNLYRARLDDLLKIGSTDADAPWQKLCYIHTDWCLHYQEAFLPWHRAHLIYLESLIDFPIPYWNWMATDASNPDSENAGLPQAFLDDIYIHPSTGEERPNPLKYACAKDGKSKDESSKWVVRFPELIDKSNPNHVPYIKKVGEYQTQVLHALTMTSFSIPQAYKNWTGLPWNNIPTFNPPPKDEEYLPLELHFDNHYEQPHDNFHGWVGPDMADNSYTAFDPVFWSHHSNIDRVFEHWLRKNPGAQFTSSFPLRPFVGTTQWDFQLSEGEPRAYIHTTLGNMAKYCKSLGYIYGPPKTPDLLSGDSPFSVVAAGKSSSMTLMPFSSLQNTQDKNHNLPASSKRLGYVVFRKVRCTDKTYKIDVFAKPRRMEALSDDQMQANIDNPYFVGTSTRLGMGDVSADSKHRRCIKGGITRAMPLYLIPAEIEDLAKDEVELVIKVTELHSGEIITREEYGKWGGFQPEFYWLPAK